MQPFILSMFHWACTATISTMAIENHRSVDYNRHGHILPITCNLYYESKLITAVFATAFFVFFINCELYKTLSLM